MSVLIPYSPRTGLKLPEYGRNIQHMVEIAMRIEDRNERNRCARTIIDCMGNMFPYLRDVEGFKHKLWDHLAIMSDFQLDIDYPYEVFKPENMNEKPDRIVRDTRKISRMHYGRIVEGFIRKLAEDENIAHRDECILAIANQMKKCYQTWNKDSVDDSIIINDLKELSNGRIILDGEKIKLMEKRYVNFNNNRRQQQQSNNNYQNNRFFQQQRNKNNNGQK